jgi:hypothetical protein
MIQLKLIQKEKEREKELNKEKETGNENEKDNSKDLLFKDNILKNDENSEVARIGFVVKNKKSNRDFEIEFTDPNDEFDNTYGIVVSNNLAAYFENNGSITELILFKAFIFKDFVVKFHSLSKYKSQLRN